MRYFLLGYMGSGKSTLGKALSEHLGADFVDLDERITEDIGKSIASFMEDKGELAFRKVEHDVLERILMSGAEDVVVALGGGTPSKNTIGHTYVWHRNGHSSVIALVKKWGR